MLQWNLKITEYADRLVDDLAPLDWPEEIKQSQRNWIGRSEGAEIDFPLMFADDKKYTYVFLHGFTGIPDMPRFVYWKKELEKMGNKVIIPALPNTDNPAEEEQVAAALAATDYDENTILLGHSLGGVVAMKVVEKLTKPIARLVLVGSFVDPNFKDHPRNFENRFVWKFDAEKIKCNTKTIQILSDVNDHAVSEQQLHALEELLGVHTQRLSGELGHFIGDKEPDILMWLRPTIRVFTTRPDTLFGATYLVLAPEHPWVMLALEHKTVLKNNEEVAAYVAQANKKTELERLENAKEKTGVKLKGVEAVNPATGEKIPLFVADYVLSQYGTGAIMAVPAHDERDMQFAEKFQLPVKVVVDNGKLVASRDFDGLTVADAKEKMTQAFGRRKTTYKLRDWIVSRQRYWGVPIPIIHCAKCGSVPVPEKELPVLLPPVKDYLPDGEGKSPLAKVKKFVEVKCPHCGGSAERETDTLDTFVDSSWYFLRYTDPKNKKTFADAKKMAQWMPVDLYSGGAEHTTMHLLYSRFWHKALFDLGLVADAEPYKRRMNRSIILGPDGQKMSKSRGNVIDPDEVVKHLGADTVRMYLAFIGPYQEVGSYPWNPDGVVGVRRFLERVWRAQEWVGKNDTLALDSALHKAIKKVGEDAAAMKFNTAISALMIFLNALEKEKAIGKKQWELFLTLLAPFAPHMTEELWQASGHKKSIHLEAWPEFDEALLIDDEITIAIQINGKTRGEVKVPAAADKAAIEQAAKEAAAQRLEGKAISRTIVVPDRLVNFVVAE